MFSTLVKPKEMDNDGQQLIPGGGKRESEPEPQVILGAEAGSPQPVILFATTEPQDGPTVRHKYDGHRGIILGLILACCGVLEIIFNAVLIALIQLPTQLIGHGIWVGLLYVISGVITVMAGRWRTTCMVVGSMVICIIACVFTAFLLGFSGGALGTSGGMHYRFTQWNETTMKYTLTDDGRSALVTSRGLDSMMIICGLTSLACALWAAINACSSFSCCQPPKQTQAPVQFNPNKQQQVILMIQGDNPFSQGSAAGAAPVKMTTGYNSLNK